MCVTIVENGTYKVTGLSGSSWVIALDLALPHVMDLCFLADDALSPCIDGMASAPVR